MKKFFLQNAVLILIVFLGVILRTVFLQTSPPSLNEDEAALGYNAYSILKTGADEHGRFLPLTLESFGDWKLPGYVYADVIPVAVLGLTEFSTRLPSILAGIIGIILIYLICEKLFKKKSVSLFSAFFFAVSPWSIYFSRAAYEVNLATTFFLGGLFVFLYAKKENKRFKVLLIISGILFGLTLLTYHSYIVFTPLFVLFISLYYFKVFKINLLYLLIPFVFLVYVSAASTLGGGNTKLTTTTIFNNKDVIYNRVEIFKRDHITVPLIFDKIHTKYLGIPYQMLQNYLASFSPTFLFDKGGEKLVHNLNGFGNLYIFDAFLLAVGFTGLFYFREKNIPILSVWIILAPIPSALTLDAQNSTRLFILIPFFSIISGYGSWLLLKILKKSKVGRMAIVLLAFIFILNILYFLNLYFIHNQYSRAKFWRYGNKEIVTVANRYPEKKIITQGIYDFPYIYFLFYNRYDPKKFRNEVKYYPVSYDGFSYVKSFGRYSFVKALSDVKEESGMLYIDNQNFHVGDSLILLPNGDPIFKYYFGK